MFRLVFAIELVLDLFENPPGDGGRFILWI
jgi:hypothetical protein